jgi:tetratricopeptide (TPR) repeat protein
MREMLAALVPDLPAQALSAIVDRADGIPLYAVETVRMLLADGRLKALDGVYRPTGELGNLEVPESLRSLIAARLDALPPADRRLLQDASVLGQAFTLDALNALTGTAPGDLSDQLRGLIRRELLTLDADPRSPERGQYAFVQSLIREVAYSTLARPERRERHLAAARYLESQGADELAAALAGHYVAAHAASSPGPEAEAVATQARIALRAAADRASSLAGHKQAADLLEQALTLTTEPADRAAILERLSIELTTAGRYVESETKAREGLELIQNGDDQAAIARLRGLIGRSQIDQGRVVDAIQMLETTLAQLPADTAPSVRADMLAKLARAYYRNIDWQKSLDTAEQALILAEKYRLLFTLGEAMITKATALQMASRFVESLALFTAGLAIAKREGDVESAFRAQANMGALLAFDESTKAALASTRDALATARAMGDLGMTVWYVGNLLNGAVFGGNALDAILAEADELLALDLDENDRAHILSGYMVAGSMHGLDVRGIEAELEKAVDPQMQRGLDFERVFAHTARGEWQQASEAAERANNQRPSLGMLPNAAITAGLAGDVQRMRHIVELGRDLPINGRLGEAIRSSAEGLLLVAEGRDSEGMPAVRDGLRLADSMKAEFYFGMVALALLRFLGPQSPEARAAGEQALANFERNKNRAMAGHIRALLSADTQPAASSPSEVVRVGT